MFCGSVLYESGPSPVSPLESSPVPSGGIVWKQFVGVRSTASSPSRRSSSLTYSKRRRRATMYSSSGRFLAYSTTPRKTGEKRSRFFSQNSQPKW